jgi:hypothetical protein
MRSQQRAANLLSPAAGNERGLTLGSTMRRWLAATALAGGLVATGSPAIAAQTTPSLATHTLSTQQQVQAAARDFPGMKAVPDAVGDESQICLTNAPKYCIKTNGPGNPVTITNVAANKANFTVVFDVETDHAWQDGNGNCLREGTGSVVKMENGPCDFGDPSDMWTRLEGNTTWYNQSNNFDIMYTNGPANGNNVWAKGTPPSGSYSKWNAPT